MNRKMIIALSLILIIAFLGVQAATANFSSVADTFYNLLPIIKKGQAVESAFPGGVLYVFATNTTTDGNAGGRPGMNAICTAEDPGSFFCTKQLIESAFNSTGVYFPVDNITNPSWIDNAYFDTHNNAYRWDDDNCYGWSLASSGGVTLKITQRQ